MAICQPLPQRALTDQNMIPKFPVLGRDEFAAVETRHLRLVRPAALAALPANLWASWPAWGVHELDVYAEPASRLAAGQSDYPGARIVVFCGAA